MSASATVAFTIGGHAVSVATVATVAPLMIAGSAIALVAYYIYRNDREAAEGEAAGAASSPTQKISYITGKWQIMRLLGRYRDKQGDAYRLGAFHDQLLSYGTLPVSVIEWLMLDDDTSLRKALE